jgi:hypothetical protein
MFRMLKYLLWSLPLLAWRWLSEGTYTSGVGGVVYFTPDSTGIQITTINNRGWDTEEMNRLAEVTNAQSGGEAKWLATVREGSGTFEVNFNTAATPDSVGLTAGATGTMICVIGNAVHQKSMPTIIEKIAFKSVAKGGEAVTYTVSWKRNGAVTNS